MNIPEELIYTKEHEWIKVDEKNSGLIDVSVLMQEPELSSAIANYISNYLIKFVEQQQKNFAIKNREFIDRIIWYFAGVSGMIIGSGYIFQASVLIVLIYIILRNSERLINYLDRENDQSDDKVVENITN